MADFRSDTATRPSPAMYRAMAEAELGDDCKQDDPTVNALQERAAAALGKEAGLFFPSGTQSNCTALLTHCGRGEEVVLGESYHIFLYEGGGLSALGGLVPRTLPVEADGGMDPARIQGAIRPDDHTSPRSRLISLENTTDGRPLSRERMEAMLAPARACGLSAHLDGARIWNAAAALGCTPAHLAEPFDSVSMCLSKGLGAPIGTVLAGEAAFIREAARWRRKLGGGMRQAGVVAACGLVALEETPPLLAEDHRRAAHLYEGLRALAEEVQARGGNKRLEILHAATNMIFLRPDEGTQSELVQAAAEAGHKLGGRGLLRIVLHRDITDADTDSLLAIFQRCYAP